MGMVGVVGISLNLQEVYIDISTKQSLILGIVRHKLIEMATNPPG